MDENDYLEELPRSQHRIYSNAVVYGALAVVFAMIGDPAGILRKPVRFSLCKLSKTLSNQTMDKRKKSFGPGKRDWLMRTFIGGTVVWFAMLTGLVLSQYFYR